MCFAHKPSFSSLPTRQGCVYGGIEPSHSESPTTDPTNQQKDYDDSEVLGYVVVPPPLILSPYALNSH